MARLMFGLVVVVFFSLPLFAAELAAEEGWQTYVDNTYKVMLRFPSDWKKDPGYFDRPYFGSERKPHSVVHSFQLGAVGGGEVISPEQACKGEAEHVLKPFGVKPTIRSTKVDGQSACLIFPSKDQGAPWYAAAFVKYPEPVQIEGDRWSILALYADKDYFDRIMGSVRFISSAHAPPFSLAIAPGEPGAKSDASWQAGSPFTLLLMMENSSEKAIQVLLADPASDRVAAIHRDEPVRVTANLPAMKRGLTTALLTTLKPNQSCGDLIDIRFWADNPATGKYSIQVERDFPAELGKGLVESNTLTVTVIH